MKTIVIPDIHNDWETAEKIASFFSDRLIIFIGDYFDNFHDTPEQAAETAIWLKESLYKKNRIHLKGNHDECYDPRYQLWCSGFTREKKQTINKILSIEDWERLEYFYAQGDWWYSHAGVTEYWFASPYKGINAQIVSENIREALKLRTINNSKDDCIWAADFYRGGCSNVGGILWCDWRSLTIIPGVKQVVGHTPIKNIEFREDSNGAIINVDCSAKQNARFHQLLEIDESGAPYVFDWNAFNK